MLGGGAVSWGSKKQTRVTDSTMVAEFVTLVSTCKEIKWLRNLFYDIPLWSKLLSPISIYCNSATTLAKVYSQVYTGKSRHIGLKHSYVKNLITNGFIPIDFVRFSEKLSDLLTKELLRDLVLKTSRGMDLKSKLNDH